MENTRRMEYRSEHVNNVSPSRLIYIIGQKEHVYT